MRGHEHPRLGWVPVPRVRIGGRHLPVWAVLIGVFAASRIVSTSVL